MKTIRFPIALVLLSLWVSGCVSSIPNVKPGDDLGGKKLLIGQLECYNDEKKHTCAMGYKIFIQKEGAEANSRLEPDRKGYVYAAVEPGTYNFRGFVPAGISGVAFRLSTYPSVTIGDDDKTVNFGTIRFRYQQSVGSHISAFLLGIGKAYLSVEIFPDFVDAENAVRTQLHLQGPITRREAVMTRQPTQK